MNFCAYLLPMGGLIFIAGDFPSWMVIHHLSYSMGDFISLALSD